MKSILAQELLYRIEVDNQLPEVVKRVIAAGGTSANLNQYMEEF